jgi:CRP-like cAMP-binding protein
MRKKLSKDGNASSPKDQLIDIFSSYYPLSEELKNQLTLRLKTRQLQKGHCLAIQGEYCVHFYYLVEGILISTTNRSDKQLTTFIVADGSFVTSISGMYGQKPSDESIFAIENTLVIGLHAQDFHYFYQHHPEMNTIMRCIMERCFQEAHERSKMIRLGTAKEKYLYLLEHIPQHINRIPIPHQANYLGIREETLKRIQKEIQIENDEKQTTTLFKKIEHHLLQTNIVYQPKITLKSFATTIDIPAHQLSSIIKAKYKKSFNQLIHSLKIDHVKKRLSNISDHKHLTLEGIGTEAGFTSRSVFFSEFKKQTGLSPGEYLKKLHQ